MPNSKHRNTSESIDVNQLAYGECPQCNSPLVLKHVGKNSFLACTAYPKCDYTHSLHTLEVTTLKIMEDSLCPKCDSSLAVKKGRYGMFIGCTNFPKCEYISNNKSNQSKQDYTPAKCTSCDSGYLQKKQNRFGKFFYACDNYPKCKFILNQEPVELVCPSCQAPIMLKHKKRQASYICARSSCEYIVNENGDN